MLRDAKFLSISNINLRRIIKIAKISPVSIKYKVYAKFEATGALDKPDVIGALFGQTEGLLGSDLEMRELQKEGKIGRVDVELRSEGGKTTGRIEIPSALDKAETSIIAAAIETIDRIGPSDAKIEIERIEDVRGNKRDYIIDRAKKLLEGIEGKADSREISDKVKVNFQMGKIKECEGLPCGDISGHEIIVVEGRADVVNLVKNNVNNVIAMNGTILPEAIKELSYDKEITLFVDGDRGGRLIARNAVDNARIDFIAVAPDGKEVEELVGKEILVCLRRKVSVSEFFRSRNEHYSERRPETREAKTETSKELKTFNEDEKAKIKEMMNEIDGKKKTLLLDKELNVLRNTSSGSTISALRRLRGIDSIIIDGTVTSPLIREAKEAGVSHIIAKNFASFEEGIDLVSL